MSDAFNCGQCGHVCGTGATCSGGVCKCGSATCMANETCCSGTCQTSCVTDMGTALDMSPSGGLCQCASHCATDPIAKWCVGPECCYTPGIAGACTIGPCQINMAP
jgi:hypothetical protein